MLAYDVKAGKLYFGKDGQWLNGSSGLNGGNPAIGSGALLTALYPALAEGKKFYPYVSPYSSGQNMSINFGQKPFKFPPPDGFQPINAANVRPENVIARPDQFVGATLWTGNGGTRNIDVGHKSDFVWIKKRNSSSYGDHMLFDTVRGATKFLSSHDDGVEGTDATTLTAFTSNGFTIGGGWEVNKANDTYVAWTWKAGGNKGTFNVDDVGYASAAAAGLTAGTITPTGASVGTRQGFSIIKFTGTGSAGTLPHGLSQAPGFVVVKNLDATAGWLVWVNSFSSTEYLVLNLSNAKNSNSGYFNGTPSSTTFSVSTANNTNGDSDDMIAYLWHDVPGLQKFGSYSGNDNTNGTHIELGFKPVLIIIKSTGSSGNWGMWDTSRDPSNPAYRRIRTHTNNAESGDDANVYIDILSNGFKLRNGDTDSNDGTYVYMAWAEAPTVNLFGGQSNAR
jgi:hypothetical protein